MTDCSVCFFIIILAANISAAVLPTLSRDNIRDLFPGPEHFLRRKTIWEMFHEDKEVELHSFFQTVLTFNEI